MGLNKIGNASPHIYVDLHDILRLNDIKHSGYDLVPLISVRINPSSAILSMVACPYPLV